MASPLAHAIPEHWTELSAAKRQRWLCADDVAAIRRACATGCGQQRVDECATCYAKVLDRMRARYTDSVDREWFTQRKAFLHELEGLFQEAKEGRRSLGSVEARIESEKEAWYRWVLRTYPEFIAVSGSGALEDELRVMLDDPDRSREELVGMMLHGVGKPGDWPRSVDAFADRAAALRYDGAALKRFYVGEFLTDKAGGALEFAQKYLDEYRATETMALEDVVGKIALDMREGRSWQPQRDTHQKRLDELRRAKTAFEHNKRLAKSQAAAAQAAAAKDELYNLPRCGVCDKAADASKVLSCSLCQAVAQMGGGSRMTVYCSEECLGQGHDKHVEAEHGCAAGATCVQLGDEDVEMEEATWEATWDSVWCRACVGDKRATVFCSERCAEANAAGHRQQWHGVGEQWHGVGEPRAAGGAQGLVARTQEVVEAALARENRGLALSWVRH